MIELTPWSQVYEKCERCEETRAKPQKVSEPLVRPGLVPLAGTSVVT